MTFMTEVDPVVTEGSLLADETSKEEQLKAAAERINNAELTEGELDESMAPEHYEASDLRVLEGLEAVRIRPGMYIGSTGPRGLHHLVYEIVDNSVDEALAGYASHIEVSILPDNGIVDGGKQRHVRGRLLGAGGDQHRRRRCSHHPEQVSGK